MFKKNKSLIFVFIIILIFFGIIVFNMKSNLNGIYYCEDWNGKKETIHINKNQECIYLGNNNCTWQQVSDNQIEIVVKESYVENKKIEIKLDENINDLESAVMILDNKLKSITGVDGVEVNNGKTINLWINEDFDIFEINNQITKLENVETTVIDEGDIVEITEKEYVQIIENGLLVKNHIFKKID